MASHHRGSAARVKTAGVKHCSNDETLAGLTWRTMAAALEAAEAR